MTAPTPAQVAALKELGFRENRDKPGLWFAKLNDGRYLNADFRRMEKYKEPNFYAGKPGGGVEGMADHPLAKKVLEILAGVTKTAPEQPPALLKEPTPKQKPLSPQHIPQKEGGGGASGEGLSEVMPPPSHPPDAGDIYIQRANKGGLWRTYRFTAQDYERIEADTLARNAAIAKKIFLAVAGDRKEGERRTADLPILVAQAAPLIDHALTHPWHAFERWADAQIYSGAKTSEEELRERGERDAKEP